MEGDTSKKDTGVMEVKLEVTEFRWSEGVRRGEGGVTEAETDGRHVDGDSPGGRREEKGRGHVLNGEMGTGRYRGKRGGG